MMIVLNRLNKSKSNSFPWLVNSDYIITVNGTRYGTLVVVDGSTDDAYVKETVEEVAGILNASRLKGNDNDIIHESH